MSMRGWSSDGLEILDEAERYWTVREAARLLGPPVLTEHQVRQLIIMMQLEPVGVRRPDRPDKRGRQPRAYRALDLIKAHDLLSNAR